MSFPEIEYIKNVTAFANFVASPGAFTATITGMPSHSPDVAVIRAINWNGQAVDGNLYLLWCNLTNDYVGSFCGGALAPHFPQTHILLHAPVPTMLEFKLYTPTPTGVVQIPNITGDLAVHMDFVRYKKAPLK
jgi:hypothetical protein